MSRTAAPKANSTAAEGEGIPMSTHVAVSARLRNPLKPGEET